MDTVTPDSPLNVCGHCIEEGDLPLGAATYDAFVIVNGGLRTAWWDGDEWVQAPPGSGECPTCAQDMP